MQVEKEKQIDLYSELQDIKKRLGVVEDIEEIKQLQYKYLNSLMFTKYDEIAEYFAKNSTIDFLEDRQPVTGRDNIEKYFKEDIAKIHVGKEGDFTIHPVITVDGNTAKGNWVMYMMYFYPRTGQSLFWVQGIYDADYIKEDGKWKFYILKWRERLGIPGGGPPTGIF